LNLNKLFRFDLRELCGTIMGVKMCLRHYHGYQTWQDKQTIFGRRYHKTVRHFLLDISVGTDLGEFDFVTDSQT